VGVAPRKATSCLFRTIFMAATNSPLNIERRRMIECEGVSTEAGLYGYALCIFVTEKSMIN